MRCHYEVLNVPRDAEESEIKSAYKKLALRWHPDKNLSNPDEAKEQFQLVQQAYEVLSDRQERAWYDNHRDQILHGSNKDYEDNCLDLFQYFTSSCYKGFGDDDAGFYAVYRNVFEQIAKEDLEFMEDKSDFTSIPMFGKAESDYESIVRPFYAYWMSYFTKRSYVWLDPYDIRDSCRRVVKLIEKENKKVRAKAKKERNDEVRNLVAFVKKRDKRVQANVKLLEQKALENKKRAQELALQARRERQAASLKLVQGEWTKFDNVQEELANIEKQLAAEFDDEDKSDEEESDLYCVACNKVFKTPKAFANHESSKKHKENVERLKEEMLEEEEEFDDDDLGIDEQIPNNLQKNSSTESILDLNSEDQLEEEEEIIEETTKAKKKKSKKKNKQNVNILMESEDEELEVLIDLQTSRKTKDTIQKQEATIDDESVKHEEHTKQEEQEQQNGDDTATSEITNGITDDKTAQKKTKRRKDKKCKSAIKVDATNINNIDIEHTCVTCKSVFPSKNKLFDHLKKTGHGVYIAPEDKSKFKDVSNGKTKSKRGKREERRKRVDDSD